MPSEPSLALVGGGAGARDAVSGAGSWEGRVDQALDSLLH